MSRRTATVNRMIARAGVETAARLSIAECATPTTASNAAKMDMGVPLIGPGKKVDGGRRVSGRRGVRGRGSGPRASGGVRIGESRQLDLAARRLLTGRGPHL